VYDDKDLVVKIHIGLPEQLSPTGNGTLSLPRYEYALQPPVTPANCTIEQKENLEKCRRDSEEVYMKVTAKQIVKGMKNKNEFRTTKQTLQAIPKHLFAVSATSLAQNQGTGWKTYKQGWGICSVQGWALKKMLISMGVISAIGLAIFIVWLCVVDHTDLQNASTPFFMLLGVMALALAIPQYLDIA
jgi:hypothetical protein